MYEQYSTYKLRQLICPSIFFHFLTFSVKSYVDQDSLLCNDRRLVFRDESRVGQDSVMLISLQYVSTVTRSPKVPKWEWLLHLRCLVRPFGPRNDLRGPRDSQVWQERGSHWTSHVVQNVSENVTPTKRKRVLCRLYHNVPTLPCPLRDGIYKNTSGVVDLQVTPRSIFFITSEGVGGGSRDEWKGVRGWMGGHKGRT